MILYWKDYKIFVGLYTNVLIMGLGPFSISLPHPLSLEASDRLMRWMKRAQRGCAHGLVHYKLAPRVEST